MKKRIISLFAICTLAIVMCGCSSSGSSSVGKVASSEPQELVVADSNYVIDDGGYVYYALEIENPNTDFAAEFATVTVTGKHADGSISFSDEWVISNLMPGSDTYWASQAGDGDVTESDTIEIKLSVDKDNWGKTDKALPEELYTFENVSVKKDQYGGLSAKGEITLTEDYKVGPQDAESPILVCVLKDADGKIITGFSGFMSSDLTVGDSSVFDIDSYFDAVKYSTAEMHANMWM